MLPVVLLSKCMVGGVSAKAVLKVKSNVLVVVIENLFNELFIKYPLNISNFEAILLTRGLCLHKLCI